MTVFVTGEAEDDIIVMSLAGDTTLTLSMKVTLYLEGSLLYKITSQGSQGIIW